MLSCHLMSEQSGSDAGAAGADFNRLLMETLSQIRDGDMSCRVQVESAGRFAALAGLVNQILDMLAATQQRYEQHREAAEELRVTVEMQRAALGKVSLPILEVWERILCMPIVGVLDRDRCEQMMSSVLEQASRRRARQVILDITGLEHLDEHTANHLLKVCHALALLGTGCVLTGLSPDVARTLATSGTDLGGVRALRTLYEALQRAVQGSG